MALGEAILVCLIDRPMSGYDLAKTFDASIGFFWRASHQQVYRELAKLRDRGLVASQEFEQQGKPNRIVHKITPKGRSAVHSWSQQPSRVASFKDELFVKLYALDEIDLTAMREQVGVRIDFYKERLARYERIYARYFKGRNLSINEKGRLIALELGIQNETQWIESLERALTQLTEIEENG